MVVIVHNRIEKYENEGNYCQLTPLKNGDHCTSLVTTPNNKIKF